MREVPLYSKRLVVSVWRFSGRILCWKPQVQGEQTDVTGVCLCLACLAFRLLNLPLFARNAGLDFQVSG